MGEYAAAKSPVFLQRALQDEIIKITQNMKFHAPGTEELQQIKVYRQRLPIPGKKESAQEYSGIEYSEDEQEEGIFKCPWCTVEISEGSVTEIDGDQTVSIIVKFGIYNNSTENTGHEDILSLIFALYRRFATDPILDRQFIYKGTFNWGLNDEDVYPYYFGAATMDFSFCGFRRESSLA